MGLLVATVFGMIVWIVLWAINISGFDAILIVVLMMLVAVAVRQVLPFLPGRRD